MIALFNKNKSGFTIIELLVVIALIGILLGAALVSMSGARESGRVGKAKTDLEDIKLAFQLYVERVGEMPGAGYCSHCRFRNPAVSPNDSESSWESVIIPEVKAAVDITVPSRDPWGNFYLYDDNFIHSGTEFPSIICSRGRDGQLDTWLTSSAWATERVAQDDDVCVFFNEIDDN
ncbi:type II secretion system GspH family protein [Patescibacteria group bacterium]|nr:type II secretion system GspH family protein [Patescibacteria group bacterium]